MPKTAALKVLKSMAATHGGCKCEVRWPGRNPVRARLPVGPAAGASIKQFHRRSMIERLLASSCAQFQQTPRPLPVYARLFRYVADCIHSPVGLGNRNLATAIGKSKIGENPSRSTLQKMFSD